MILAARGGGRSLNTHHVLCPPLLIRDAGTGDQVTRLPPEGLLSPQEEKVPELTSRQAARAEEAGGPDPNLPPIRACRLETRAQRG